MIGSDVDSGPDLLLDWQKTSHAPELFRAGAGSFLFHVVLIIFALLLPRIHITAPREPPDIRAELRRATPLVDPPMRLTQKAPNLSKLSKELNVDNLIPPPSTVPHRPAPAAKRFRPPAPKSNAGAPRITEPPKIETATNAPQVTIPAGAIKAPPPQIQPEEKPKLAFENPGEAGTSPKRDPSLPKIPTPKTTLDEDIRSVARGGAEMEQPPKLPGNITPPPAPGMELLSDPMGVDFRPYLARILALVRRNWFAVLPESARMGDHGVVLLQFAIDRNGQVPKLVIATPSGTESLDRAAVAGISASVPFPPLPSEFKGREIRLQFSFKYNVR